MIVALVAASARGAGPRPDGYHRAEQPRPPYRLWYQPRLLQRDLSLYSHMTIDGSGYTDPSLAEKLGKTTLIWAFGLNHPSMNSPDYWRDSCSPRRRMGLAGRLSEAASRSGVVAAGVAFDEWTRPKPDAEALVAEGIRAGKAANPDCFVAIWFSKPTPTLLKLAAEGSVDLLIFEGYTHAPERLGEGEWISVWKRVINICEKIDEENLADKTIVCLGQITDEPDKHGRRLSFDEIREMAVELRERFPAMPGIGFYQAHERSTSESLRLIRACNELSAELWPDR